MLISLPADVQYLYLSYLRPLEVLNWLCVSKVLTSTTTHLPAHVTGLYHNDFRFRGTVIRQTVESVRFTRQWFEHGSQLLLRDQRLVILELEGFNIEAFLTSCAFSATTLRELRIHSTALNMPNELLQRPGWWLDLRVRGKERLWGCTVVVDVVWKHPIAVDVEQAPTTIHVRELKINENSLPVKYLPPYPLKLTIVSHLSEMCTQYRGRVESLCLVNSTLSLSFPSIWATLRSLTLVGIRRHMDLGLYSFPVLETMSIEDCWSVDVGRFDRAEQVRWTIDRWSVFTQPGRYGPILAVCTSDDPMCVVETDELWLNSSGTPSMVKVHKRLHCQGSFWYTPKAVDWYTTIPTVVFYGTNYRWSEVVCRWEPNRGLREVHVWDWDEQDWMERNLFQELPPTVTLYVSRMMSHFLPSIQSRVVCPVNTFATC